MKELLNDRTKELNVVINKNENVCVFSDTHGDKQMLDKALILIKDYEKKNNEIDTLIINGDICNKGSGSLKSLQLIIKLENSMAADNKKLFVTYGNHEQWMIDCLINLDVFEENYEWLNAPDFGTLVGDMILEILKENKNISKREIFKEIHNVFKDEINFLLNDFVYSVEYDNVFIVHTGFNTKEPIDLNDLMNREEELLRLSNYADVRKKEIKNGKLIITGHQISNCYRKSVNSLYYINEELNVLCLDGGCTNEVIDGQINIAFFNTKNVSLKNITIEVIYFNKGAIELYLTEKRNPNTRTMFPKFFRNSQIPKEITEHEAFFIPDSYKEKCFKDDFFYTMWGSTILNKFEIDSKDNEKVVIHPFCDNWSVAVSLDSDYSGWINIKEIRKKVDLEKDVYKR